jgi:HD-GYP domain-containing protein (c-di-GMP phosphodiesterase class II)
MPATVSMTNRYPLPRLGKTYVSIVILAGAVIAGFSVHDLITAPLRTQWVLLAALTLLSGSATVKLPSVPATISISETFVFTSVLLYGPGSGALIVALDGLIISFWFSKRRKEIHRILFNMAAPALSIWLAGRLYYSFPNVLPLVSHPVEIHALVVPLATFALAHFFLNSWLIAFAVAFETQRRPIDIWRNDFLWLSLNYFGGASVSALLVVYTRDIDYTYLGIIVPLLLILYFTFKIPMARVEDTNRHLTEVNSLYISTIETLAMAIDAKDQITHGHIRRVQTYAVGLGKALGISDIGLLKAIEAAALLHDMGKLAIPEHILNKPGKLTDAEFEKMKLHAGIGADILSAIEFPYPVVPIVRHHHENWDGTGYPDKLSGTNIPIGARILAVVDCYDALTSDRPYRPSLSDEAAVEILKDRRGRMYDPFVVDTFIRVHNDLLDQRDEPQSDHAVTLTNIARLAAKMRRPADSENSPCHPANRPVSSARDEDVHTTLREAIDRFDAQCGLLATYNSERDELAVRAVCCEHLSPMLGSVIELGHGLTGWVGANREAIVNSDAALDLDESLRAPLALRWCLSVPLIEDGALLAVVSVFSNTAFPSLPNTTLRVIGADLSSRLVASRARSEASFAHMRHARLA